MAITKSMTIGKIVEKHPEAVPVMLSHGLHCVGCHVAGAETLEQGCLAHGMSKKDVASMLKDINGAIKAAKNVGPITLTPLAATKIKEILASEKHKGLRVIATSAPAGPKYDMHLEDKKKKDDKLFEEHGVRIFIDKASLKLLKGSTIDFVDVPDGGFRISKPNR